jgi:acyl-CoA synthetase (AMP-forming)/AMP-acid ligase II
MSDIPKRGPMRGGMMHVPMLISEMIRYAAEYHGDVEVVGRRLDHTVERSSWSAIHQRSARIANALHARGFDENARIATLAWNTLDHLVLFYGVLGLGIPLHTLNPRLSTQDLAYMAELVEDDLCFFDADNLELATGLASVTNAIRTYVFLGEVIPAGAVSLPNIMTLNAFLGDAQDVIEWPEFEEDRAATICFTSGTTGKPKGVAYSHRSITLSALNMSGAAMYAHSIPGEAETVMPVAAMYHANAWMMPFTAPMNGQKLVLPGRRLDAEAIVDLIVAENVTLAGAVPTIWMDVIGEFEKRGITSTTLRTALVAGAPLPTTSAEAMIAHGITPRQTWGMTEVPGAARASPPHGACDLDPAEQLRLAVERQGRVAMQAQLRIVDEAGNRLPHDGNAKGFLQVRGSTVCGRYLGEEGEAPIWLDTGDIAIIYPDSTLAIVDRAKDAIKSGGEWIASPLLEAAAMQHAGVREAAAIGIPHPRWQERPMLVCVGKEGTDRPGDEALKACMVKHVAKWWLPDRIEWINELPRTPTGKLDKIKLREIMGVSRA